MSGLRGLRERDGLSVDELARRLGLPARVIEDWEAGLSSPNDLQVATLARIFHVSHAAVTDPTGIITIERATRRPDQTRLSRP